MGTRPQFSLIPLVLFNWAHASKPLWQISALISLRPGSSSVQLLTSLVTIKRVSPPNLPAVFSASEMGEGDFKDPNAFFVEHLALDASSGISVSFGSRQSPAWDSGHLQPIRRQVPMWDSK